MKIRASYLNANLNITQLFMHKLRDVSDKKKLIYEVMLSIKKGK